MYILIRIARRTKHHVEIMSANNTNIQHMTIVRSDIEVDRAQSIGRETIRTLFGHVIQQIETIKRYDNSWASNNTFSFREPMTGQWAVVANIRSIDFNRCIVSCVQHSSTHESRSVADSLVKNACIARIRYERHCNRLHFGRRIKFNHQQHHSSHHCSLPKEILFDHL